MLDRQHAGYMTEVQVDGAKLEIPTGRTIAVPLPVQSEILVATLASDLAPYVVMGFESQIEGRRDLWSFTEPTVLTVREQTLEAHPWDPARPWAADREWLRGLHDQCNLANQAEVSIRAEPENISVRMGSCSGKLPRPAASGPPLLMVVSGPYTAYAVSPDAGWPQTHGVAWRLVLLVLLWVSLFAFALGVVPTALASGTLFAVGRFWQTAAILAWTGTFPVIVAAAAGRLSWRFASHRAGLAWAVGVVVLALEAAGIVAAIKFFDVGTFGHERITREGDDHCSIVGYSTVRGDSLRRDSAGLIERLDQECEECRNRTSRFSREAQTLRWVREVVCSPSFPTPDGGNVVFLGGSNDDLFYRPTGLLQLLADFAGTLRFLAQPTGASDWESVFNQVSQHVVGTLDEQEADVHSIVECSTRGNRRFFFLHDFLIWDLEHNRTPARRLALERRRRTVLSSGGEFIDLLEEFRQTAGVAWLNDFIHPSAVGQQMIADLLCKRLAQD